VDHLIHVADFRCVVSEHLTEMFALSCETLAFVELEIGACGAGHERVGAHLDDHERHFTLAAAEPG